MKVQINKYLVTIYPSCSLDDIVRMGFKPDHIYDEFYCLTVTNHITEENLFSKAIGYNLCEPTLCYLNGMLDGVQVIADSRLYHFAFLDTREDFFIEFLAPIMAVIPINIETPAFCIIHEIGIKKVSLTGNGIWDIATYDTVKNFSINFDQEYLLLELYDSHHMKIHLRTGRIIN